MRRITPSRLRVLAVLLALVIPALGASSAHAATCAAGPTWPASDTSSANQVVALINAHRADVGLPALAVSPTLSAAAAWKARHMAAYGYLDHNDPAPPVAQTFDQRIAACGYPGSAVGENIAEGQPTAQAVVDAWLTSPGHRANIERPQYAATGVGAARSASGVIFWSQEFGDVVDQAATPPAAPTSGSGSAPGAGGGAPASAPAQGVAGNRATSPVREVRLVRGRRVLVVLRHSARVVVEVRRRTPTPRRAGRATLRLTAGVHRVRLPTAGRRLRPGRYRITVAVPGTRQRWSLPLVIRRA